MTEYSVVPVPQTNFYAVIDGCGYRVVPDYFQELDYAADFAAALNLGRAARLTAARTKRDTPTTPEEGRDAG